MIRFNKDGTYELQHRGGVPHIQWNHVDGPVLTRSDGSMHWLTWWERFCLFFGFISVGDLDPAWPGEDE